ncbi:MAG: lytic transglycosylase domain-containing protein [Acetobacteraceae bacterium]
MRYALLAAIAALSLAPAAEIWAAPAGADSLTPNGAYIRACLVAAGNAYREPAALLVILLNVEGGRLGAVSPNTNRTVDIGPMQVNSIWVPKVAQHWATTQRTAYLALRDNFCANVEAGAWILRIGLDEARGDLWEGVGFYHSHDPDYRRTYLASVLKQALRLQARSRVSRVASPVPPAKPPSPTAPRILAAAPVHDSSKGY